MRRCFDPPPPPLMTAPSPVRLMRRKDHIELCAQYEALNTKGRESDAIGFSYFLNTEGSVPTCYADLDSETTASTAR